MLIIATNPATKPANKYAISASMLRDFMLFDTASGYVAIAYNLLGNSQLL